MSLLNYVPQYFVLLSLQGAQADVNDWLTDLSLGEHYIKELSSISNTVTCSVNDLLNISEQLEKWYLKKYYPLQFK